MGHRGVEKKSDADGNLFIISNGGHLSLVVSEWGVTLRQCLWDGRNLTLAYKDPHRFHANPYFLSSTIGRYANRIAKGRFKLDGREISLETNNGVNHLHGGSDGFQSQRWEGSPTEGFLSEGENRIPYAGVHFKRLSPDGEARYPGNMNVEVLVGVTDDDALFFKYRAVCDAPTIVNLTNHSYWNLDGDGGSVHDHKLRLSSPGWLEVDKTSIPTGVFVPLAGSAWNFSQARTLASSLSDRNFLQARQLERGIDHCFLVDPQQEKLFFKWETTNEHEAFSMRHTADLQGKDLLMEVFTSLPGVQVYTSNFLDREPGLAGDLRLHGGVCLETQLLPDSPNQVERFRQIGKSVGYSPEEMSHWDAKLVPQEVWSHATLHRFSLKN